MCIYIFTLAAPLAQGADVGVLLSLLRARGKAARAKLSDFVGDSGEVWAPKMLEIELDALQKARHISISVI